MNAISERIDLYRCNLLYLLLGSVCMFCDNAINHRDYTQYIHTVSYDATKEDMDRIKSNAECSDCFWNWVCYPAFMFLFGAVFHGLVFALFAVAVFLEVIYPKLFALVFLNECPMVCYVKVSQAFRSCCRRHESIVVKE